MMLNIGIVGCGKIADGHVEEIQKLGCARVLAVCDLEPILAEQLALVEDRHGDRDVRRVRRAEVRVVVDDHVALRDRRESLYK